MLKIKDNVDLKELRKFGFKLEPEHAYYFLRTIDAEVFVWSTKTEKYYKYGYIYIDSSEIPVISELSILYDLIKTDLVEKVEEEK